MARRIEGTDPWSCRLVVSPKRIRADGTVKMTLTVTLSYGETELRSGDYYHKDNNNNDLNTFSYSFSSDIDQLNTVLTDQNFVTNYQLAISSSPHTFASPPQFVFPFPTDVPDGGCVIRVTVTGPPTVSVTDKPVPFPGRGKSTSDSFSIITHLVETQSSVTLQRSFAAAQDDMAMGPAIRNRTAAIGFDRYKAFIDCVFCDEHLDAAGKVIPNPFTDIRSKIRGYVSPCLDQPDPKAPDKQQLSIYGPYAYNVLKLATQAFLTLESGVVIRDNVNGKPKIFDLQKEQIRLNDFNLSFQSLSSRLTSYLQADGGILPYLARILANLISVDPNDDERLPYCHGVLQYRLTSPSLIELIWSYWHEEGMLVQTMNAIARRFQNRRGSPHDPLGELEFDPLRPLNNLIWGFIQDEHNRLTVPRRAYEYEHHYGLSLIGKMVPDLAPADSRSKFIEAFHNLLSGASRFFKEDSDTTVIADAFPLLNALKEVHLILAEGAHNQFGDLTWTSRAEMLMIQWMMARPEMKEFLRGRYMVPYQEDWMGAVDSMKKLQGWTDTTVTHFHELAVTGERILLSIRYGDWVDMENIEDQAKIWARSWKPEIQRYIHGYRTVTGVDLAADVTDTRDAATRYMKPSVLLQRRLMEQRSTTQLPGPTGPDLIAARAVNPAALPAPGRPRLPVYREEP
jgi:hypothetical protein